MVQCFDFNNFGMFDCYRARNYNPGTGRFLSEDPIGFKSGDTNHFRYVWNNPLLNSDPYGTSGWNVPILVIGGIVVVYIIGRIFLPDLINPIIQDAYPNGEPQAPKQPTPSPSCDPTVQCCG